MSQYNKTKGSQFETDVMKWLRKMGAIAERLTKAGAKDEGDIVTVIAGQTYILELKNRATLSLPEFWREAQVEALNYAKARGIGEVPLHYVVVKRRNSGIDKAWVIQDLAQWLKEKQMPVPEGEITTTEILQTEVELAEELLATDDETLVKVLEEADAESAVEEYIVEKIKPAPRKRTKL
jgi:Holliday junction resolvase